MQLREFTTLISALDDESFRRTFSRPFLLQEGEFLAEDETQGRSVYYLQGEGSAPLLLGRSQEAVVRIRHPNLSNRHANLLPPEEEGGAWRIVDLGSANGTSIDGEVLAADTPIELRDQVHLSFAQAVSVVFLESVSFLEVLRGMGITQGGSLAESASLAGKTHVRTPTERIRKPGIARPAADDVLEDVEPNSGTYNLDAGDLVLCCDPFEPIPLRVGQTVTIGRSMVDCDLVLPKMAVSRKHAQIERRTDGVYVRDLGSGNGTLVGSRRVGTRWVRVKAGSLIDIEGFKVFLRSSEEADIGGRTLVLTPEEQKRKQEAQVERGRLKDHPLSSLLREIESKQKTGVLEVTGGRQRCITFRAGNPCQALGDGLMGVNAILRLLSLQDEAFCIKFSPKGVGLRRIPESFTDILAEYDGTKAQA